MQKSFQFDLNKCTGCQACTIACTIENSSMQEINWRDVYSFNETHLPELPNFNLSLACTHCAEPACLPACPAKAYTKDEETGAVIINSDYCIGCKYCTWACPYDAPKFNEEKKMIEKCTFCNDRLRVGDDPACIVSCPTGALKLIDWEPVEENQNIPGFTNTDLKPAIKFIPLRKDQVKPEFITNYSQTALDIFDIKKVSPKSKISLKSEWQLVVFTSIILLLVSWFTSHIVKDVKMNAVIFAAAGFFAMGLSTSHLGKKLKAFRAILNFKTSWLSREIVFVSVFMVLSFFKLFLIKNSAILEWITIAAGFSALISIDMLYTVAQSRIPLYLHSASTLLTAVFLFGILTSSPVVTAAFGLIKFSLYIFRKSVFFKTEYKILPIITFFRILFGFILPLIIFFLVSVSNISFTIIIVSVILGEIIDRCEFYDELDVITPAKQIATDMELDLQNRILR